MIHELKTWPRYFEAVVSGRKTFELRKADRTFVQGDTLLLREWDPESGEYTGRSTERRITYVTDAGAQAFGMAPGFVCLGLDDGERDRLRARVTMGDSRAEGFRRLLADETALCNNFKADARAREGERDEARAEVKRLREVLREVRMLEDYPGTGPRFEAKHLIDEALKTEHNASR
jgi:hypothetical protein